MSQCSLNITINTPNDEHETDVPASAPFPVLQDVIKAVCGSFDLPADWTSLMIIVTNPADV